MNNNMTCIITVIFGFILFVWLLILTITIAINFGQQDYLNTFNEDLQTLNSGDEIVFGANRILTGSAIQHVPNTPEISILKKGTYFIVYNVAARFNPVGGNNPICRLTLNGAAILGTDGYIDTTSTSFTTTSASAIIEVDTVPVILRLENLEDNVEYQNVNIVVQKIN